ncbi:MAG TPA: hypothetical protein VLG76_01195 [Rhabdochlamydiaceae bacterium]|nr:hypothetical protein [Rhabdochlamydiaceae bacterium]
MLKENLKDAGEIIQNILNQPLSITGAKDGISLYKAAKNFDSNEAANSDLRKILLTFLQYPEHTQILFQELELILKDIT